MSARKGILAGVLLLLLAGVAAAGTPPRSPDELWREFPLDPAVTAPVPPAPSTVTETEPAPAAPSPEAAAEPGAGSSTGWWPLVLVGLAGSLLVVASGRVVLARSAHRQPAPASTPPRPATPAELVAQARALEQEAEECNMLIREGRGRGRVVLMSKNQEQVVPAEEAEQAEQALPAVEAPLETSGLGNYAQIGDRVAAVFNAAEAAAEQIRFDAQREAAEILRVAEQDGETVRESAVAYETDTHAAVDSYAAERRREAEQQVRQQLADAEAQARATREAAEEMAVQIEETARQRQQAIYEESRSVDERLQRTLQELRRMSVQLEALVGASATPFGGESLVDALMPYSAVGAEDGARAAASGREDDL